MAETHRFRSALGGFNRQDVVQYIEYLNTKHTSQVNQLTSELEFLRRQLEQAKTEAPAETPAEPNIQNFTEAELEAYRRAERTERNARERAEQIYRQATGTLADATALVDDAAGRLETMADSVKEQLAQLQSAIETSKASLKDAANIMATIRPEGTEE
jgi:uncharacterized phage infection (PIP) family protein YhgE